MRQGRASREVLVDAGRRPRPGLPSSAHEESSSPPASASLLRAPPRRPHRPASPGDAGAVATAPALDVPGRIGPGADPSRPSMNHLGEQCCAATRTATSRASSPSASSRCARTPSGRGGPRAGIVKGGANSQTWPTPVIEKPSPTRRSAIELAGWHPTPAVGGEPRPKSAGRSRISRVMDRGWL